MEKYRDLSIMPITNEESLVIACDSSASIGLKTADFLRVSPETVARFAARVVLMEVLTVNAQPQLLLNMVGNEMEPTGKQMLLGVKKELEVAGYSHIPINGSTEENMPTKMTSVAITLIGRASSSQLKIKHCQPGDQVYQWGIPLSGQSLLGHFDQLISYQAINQIMKFKPSIKEIVPIGSKGALNEAGQVAVANHLNFKLGQELDPFYQSAGPATSFIIVVAPGHEKKLCERFKNLTKMGEFY